MPGSLVCSRAHCQGGRPPVGRETSARGAFLLEAGSGSFSCAQLRDQSPGPAVPGQLLGAQPRGTSQDRPTCWAGCSAGLVALEVWPL